MLFSAATHVHESMGLVGSLGGGAQPGRREWHGELMRCMHDLITSVTAAGEVGAGPGEECGRLAQRMLAHRQVV